MAYQQNKEPGNAATTQQWQAVFHASPDAIIVMDETGAVIQWNPMAEKLFGWTAAEITGRLLTETIIPRQYRSRHKEGLQHFLQTGQSNVLYKTTDIQALKKNNEVFDVSLNISPALINGHHLFIGFIRDISTQKITEDEIRQSREMFSTVFYKSPSMNVLSDAETGRYIDVNDSYLRFFGLTKDEISGKTIQESGIAAGIGENETLIKEVTELQAIKDRTVKLGLSNGQVKWLSVNIDMLTLFGRRCLLFTMADITLAKKAEEKFRDLLESAPDAIVIVNEKGVIQLVNVQTEKLFGYPRGEIMGQTVELLMPMRFLQAHGEHRTHYFHSPKVRQMGDGRDLYGKKKNGNEFPVEISLSPLETEEGLLVSAAIRDISEKKQMEQQIREANISLERKVKQRTEELERKNQDLEQFAYVASHDLQEPLRTTSSFVEMFKNRYQGRLDTEADTMLKYISQASERMKVLIKDLLDYSRIGRKTEIMDVDCNKVLSDAVADLSVALQTTGTSVSADPLPVIKGYPTELKLLFQNLVSNAVKFRKKNIAPAIHISALRQKDHWQFSVADNGIGIEAKHRERIFVIFQRLHTRTEYEGSGIGLSHCKKIAELHGGRIWVDSTPGEGSTFHFTIYETR